MKIKNPKIIILYISLFLFSLIFIGLVGAIIRLINIPSILITLILIGGIIYYKKIGWLNNIISSRLENKNDKKLLNLSLKSKKQAAGKSLESIDNIIKLINDKVKANALKEERNRVSLELERGDLILVVFGIGSSGKTSLIRALLRRIVGDVSPEWDQPKSKNLID